MKKNPQIFLCATKANLVDLTGNKIGEHADDADTQGMTKIDRLKHVINGISRNTTFYGLFKKDILTRVQVQKFYGSDHVFIAELSILGKFVILPELLFFSQVGGTGSSV